MHIVCVILCMFDIMCFSILDSTRRWRSDGLSSGKSSSYAFLVDAAITICPNRYR